YSTNSPARTSYPFIITCGDIKPSGSKAFNISLRFGPANARVQDLSGDVLERYAREILDPCICRPEAQRNIKCKGPGSLRRCSRTLRKQVSLPSELERPPSHW